MYLFDIIVIKQCIGVNYLLMTLAELLSFKVFITTGQIDQNFSDGVSVTKMNRFTP